MRLIGKPVCAFVLLAAAMAGFSFGSMRKMELKDLTAQATHVIVGTVLSVVPNWTAEGSIETRVQILVENYLMGNYGNGSVDLAIPGGEVDGVGLFVSDMPRFVKGTRVLLFLAMPDLLSASVVGLRQGQFTLKQGRVLETGREETEFLRLVQDEIQAKQEAK